MTPQLIATCWTSAGDTAPMRADERSPIPIAERIAVIAETGWDGIGLVHADLIDARDTIGYEALSRMIRDVGIDIVEVEFLNDWWVTGSERAAADQLKAELFEAATALGARHVKVGAGLAEEPLPLSTLKAAFVDLAAEAQDAGIRLALEAPPFSHIRTTREAVEVVTASDSPSAGLMIDIWHTHNNGLSHEELWQMVPIERVAAVEVDDGFDRHNATIADVVDDTINHRTYCGRGDFGTTAFIERAVEAGWTGPWGVEIISHDHRVLPAADGLRVARDTALECFAAAAVVGS
ncbi:sugar phosphate isomerase/epimerase [Gordonia sp. CPCC 205515]|uniref:sugar phosphate isomerase/epimerase family protein n=1 Tax=Gordonia sp. CPCC 205515 TaxID=3140791 RepID=UPI003AF3908C